jgi:hypothetical protein
MLMEYVAIEFCDIQKYRECHGLRLTEPRYVKYYSINIKVFYVPWTERDDCSRPNLIKILGAYLGA